MNGEMAGNLIKELRMTKKLSMNEFAKSIKISQPSLSRIESGSQELTFNLLVKICDKLEIPVSEFSRKLEENNYLYNISIKEITEGFIEDREGIDLKLNTMISSLTEDQKKALYVLLYPYFKK
ncbi:helix-turn-helix transcriptional regulator [Bacillus sp. J37]|uniref:helix-turn-helix domain-containing protein n=1 Tax=Bacillus sp. J37 TaxID=935837 RepID=UPI00047ED1FA|nr:helix-turn-helix transcriptional regulator [Bacillus sp. J37]